MRVVLADLKATTGFVSKDTVAGGYGSRLCPFSKVTSVICYFKRRLNDLPSIHLAYLASLAARVGHDIVFSRGEIVDGDVALVLSSLVDYRHENAWADAMRARGVRVGFVGLTASKLPELFSGSSDFIIEGEPEAAAARLFAGETLTGLVSSPPIDDLDALPFPRWDPICVPRRAVTLPLAGRPAGGAFPLLASRGCPEFCTYCPHRILAAHRMRSVDNILDELTETVAAHPRPYVVFRDPLFTERRDRVVALCEGMLGRGLSVRFECETRLDRLDADLLALMRRAGLRAISFGVESVSPATLRKVSRRPIPEQHQRRMVQQCRQLGIVTAAFYVFGFPDDDWNSIGATIEYAIDLGSTVAQFKILTPFPGTPLWQRLAPLITECDWQRFDGFTPTFRHANLTADQLMFLLGAAYTRFYIRPSYVANYLRISRDAVRGMFARLDTPVSRLHTQRELTQMARPVSC